MPSITKVGARLYLSGLTYEQSMAAKTDLGASWDGDRRERWVGVAKRERAEQWLANLGAVVMTATVGSAAVAGAVGLDADTPAGVVADKLADLGREREAANVRAGKPAQESPGNIRLTGKGRYKGREYYAGAVTRDGLKVRLLTLPDATGAYLDFWALCSEVTQTKTYTPKEVWDGRRYSNKTVLRYTTLGSIADFIAKQKANKGTDRQRVQCQECDAWHDAGEPCRECGGC